MPRPEVNDGLGCVNIRDNDRDEWHGVELIHCAEQRTYTMKTPEAFGLKRKAPNTILE